MTAQLLFVQGAGEDVHDHWDAKLVASLERELGVAVRYPLMPGEADPHYAAWKAVLRPELEGLPDGAIVIGHSIGGTILIHLLAERPLAVRLGGSFLLAAPFVGDGGWPRIDLSRRLPSDVPLVLDHSDDDESVPFTHLGLYANAIPHATIVTIPGVNHQLDDDLAIVARDIRSITAP